MAIAFDAQSSSGTYSVATSLSWSHTCTGTNRVLIVAARGTSGASDVITGVTYAGVALTKVGSSYKGSSDRWVSLWRLVGPATGANTITISASTSDILMGSSASYTGAGSVSTTTTNATAAAALTVSTSYTTQAANAWVVATVGNDQAAATAGASTAVRGSISSGICLADSNAAVSSPSSRTLVINVTPAGTWATVAAAIYEVGNSPSVSPSASKSPSASTSLSVSPSASASPSASTSLSTSPSASASASPSASYPSSIKLFSTKARGNIIDVTHITDLEMEVVAIETALVTGPFNLGSVTVSSNTVAAQSFAVSLVAGETVAARDVVYVAPTLTAGTAGRVYTMDADVLVKSTQSFFVGFATAAAIAAANVAVQVSGVVSGFSGLTAGAIYYASGTAGAITLTKPLHPFPVGMAISATELMINTGNRRETEQSENASAVYGYAMGGDTGAGTPVASTDRITFSNSITAASTVSNLTGVRYNAAGVSDGAIYGYAMGGETPSIVATTQRITFSTSVSSASTISNLSGIRRGMAGVSDGAVYGYTMGGETGAVPGLTTTDRITFSTSITAASTISNLSATRYVIAGVSDGSVYGYAMGGYSTGLSATTDRITFSTSATAASTVSNLTVARHTPAGVSDGSVYGYAMGGTTGIALTTTDRITFSTSVTAASTVSNLSLARYGATGVSDGAIYGYAMGGYSGAYVATTDRITFRTSVTAASTVSNLTVVRYLSTGVSDGAV